MTVIQSAVKVRKDACVQESPSLYPVHLAELSSMSLRITALANMATRSQAEQEELESLVMWYAVERTDILRKLSGRAV